MTRALIALWLPLSAGCLPDREILDPVAAAWGQQVAEDAAPAAQAALGMAAAASALCGYSLEEWAVMDAVAPALSAEVAGFFALEGDGTLRAWPARGQYACTYGGGSFFAREIALLVEVETPTAAFTVSLVEPGEDAGRSDDTGEPEGAVILATMGLATSRCGTVERIAAGQASFPVGGTLGWVVSTVPSEDADGLGFAPGEILPREGGLTWAGIAATGRATLTTHDAAEIAEDRWPATAKGDGWSSEVFLELP